MLRKSRGILSAVFNGQRARIQLGMKHFWCAHVLHLIWSSFGIFRNEKMEFHGTLTASKFDLFHLKHFEARPMWYGLGYKKLFFFFIPSINWFVYDYVCRLDYAAACSIRLICIWMFDHFHMQDYDYYDRYDESREMFDRRYSGMGNSSMRSSGRDFVPMGRRDPMPMPPPLRGMSSSNSMRSSGGYDTMFSRRTPPRSSNGGRFR